MIKPLKYPKVRFINLHKIGYSLYWRTWKHVKFNLTPTIEKFWHGQIIKIGMAGFYIEFDFRRGNIIDQMMADDVVRNLPKN